ncbi:ROK family protein [Neobacillus sp. Marseille-QA0830]
MVNRSIPATPNLLRLLNRQTILRLLEQSVTISRTELRDKSGLSMPTVSSVVKELLEEGWLLEAGGGISQGGKPPQLFKLNPDARYIGAIQMNHDRIRMRVANLTGEVILHEDFHTLHIPAKDLCALVSARMKALIQSSDGISEKLLGIGIAVPGVVDESGIVSDAPEFGWEHEPLKEHFTLFFNDHRVVVENDVRLAVMGEAWRRQLLSETMVYVHLSHGIGAALLIEGKLYRGAHFAAGEIGHFIVDPQTIKKPPKLQGGDQEIASQSSPGVEARVSPFGAEQGFFESHFGMRQWLEDSGNRRENEDRLIGYLAYGFVNIIALIDPESIAIGGDMPLLIDGFLDRLLEALKPLVRSMPEIYVTPFGNDAPLYGAGRCVLESSYNPNFVKDF